ncbi:hypothetical protein Dsin_013888 [Dipteronia sinensis]|uniref:ABC-2 type transporter transmembrane domain-containing protein n=1 Tax=Dipteronia sinensis TaxID=43782 RepID=A0AAE0AL95_9ROSI|nr:hypothetical protein Dsin_013888 [Dipteronia sinensis]
MGEFKFSLWKQWWTYWRSPDYNLVRFCFTFVAALVLGTIFWQSKEQSFKRAAGMYSTLPYALVQIQVIVLLMNLEEVQDPTRSQKELQWWRVESEVSGADPSLQQAISGHSAVIKGATAEVERAWPVKFHQTPAIVKGYDGFTCVAVVVY